MNKVKTINLHGNEYAQVKDRLKRFREENPHGLIKTTPHIQEDGSILFEARVLKDKTDDGSAEANGHALGKSTGAKDFEKLETIAVGRALGLLGYAADGEIASSDEMEEFFKEKEEKKKKEIKSFEKKLKAAKTSKALQTVWAGMPADAKVLLEDVKNKMKQKYENA